jgi:hypothetical protein
MHVRWLWRDEHGVVSALDPAAEGPSRPVAAGQHWLDHEIQLDGTRDTESLHLVKCAASFDHDKAVQVVQGAVRVGFEHDGLAVMKRVPR